jgi:phenylalanyl-tRNA synthetase beta chain
MRLSLNWLRDYVDIDMSAEELSRLLTMAGLEVEELTPIGQDIRDVVVAKILNIDKHPDADRLFVCLMDNGREEVSVVCGAPNLRTGDMVPMALPGAVLPNKMKVKKGRIRGQFSMG